MAQTRDHQDLGVGFQPRYPERRSRRRLLLAAGGLFLTVLVGLGVRDALAARGLLEEGRGGLERARAAFLEGDVAGAARAFRDAEGSFNDAADRARSVVVTIARTIPIAGRTPDALLAVAEAGSDVARGGLRITRAVSRLPDGLSSLGPRGGRIRVQSFEAIAPAVREAAALTQEARERVESIATIMVPGAIVEARRDTLAELTSLEGVLDVAGGLMERVPDFLGVDRPTRFFVGAQNPAELRGTGGLIGAYSILEVDDGRFSFQGFEAIQNLENFRPDEVDAPNPDYAAHYDRFGGAGFWLNINMTPDLPSAATAIQETYREATGIRLDGVLLADPFAIQALLEFTGPLDVPRFGTVEAETVVGFVSNEAYRRFDDQELRKAVLGETALTVLEAFLGEADADPGWIRTLGDTVAQGRIQVWSADPQVQAALMKAGVAGSIGPPTGSDFLSLVQNNGGGNKLDYYLDREVTYTVRLGPSGTGEGSVAVALRNTAPDSGLPRYVIGPYPGISDAGENVSFTSVYCPSLCQLRRAERNGEPIEVYGGAELGASFYQDYLRIPSGGRAEIRMDLALSEIWVPGAEGGTYRLTYLGQPTIRPTRLRIVVIPPPGTEVRRVGPGMREQDGRAVWTGNPSRVERLEVVFG